MHVAIINCLLKNCLIIKYIYKIQLKKKYGLDVVGQFPPKKFFSLSATQTDQRREQLEKYLQASKSNEIINDSYRLDLLSW